MKRREKRKKEEAKRKAAKAARMLIPGEASRYAKKRSGQVQREYNHGQTTLCGKCYRWPCICDAPAACFPGRFRRRR